MSGPAAGSYDPVKAVFYLVSDGTNAAGEPTVTQAEYCRRHIRFMTALSRSRTGERIQQQTIHNPSSTVIRLRQDSVSELITTKMFVMHRSRWYGIDSITPVHYEYDELEIMLREDQP